VYIKSINNEYVIISLFVNDMLGTSMNVVHNIKHFLTFKFNMKDMDEVSVILGIKIIRRDNGVMLTFLKSFSILKLDRKLFKKYSYFDVTSASTSYDTNTQLKKNKGEVIAHLEYAQISVSLMHLMNFTWLDIVYVVCRLRNIHNSQSWALGGNSLTNEIFERYHRLWYCI